MYQVTIHNNTPVYENPKGVIYAMEYKNIYTWRFSDDNKALTLYNSDKVILAVFILTHNQFVHIQLMKE